MRRLKTRPLQIEDHVCAICFGRITSMVSDKGIKTYLCPTCGSKAEGSRPDVICSCGAKTPRGRDLGLRCVPNIEKTPDCPYEIVARQI